MSEAEKNQPEGSNSYCHGVIPFKILTGSFNPGEVVSFYLSLLPEGDDGALFPQSRDKSKKFNPHSKSDMMYETKRTVGKNKFSEMLPTLCEIIGRPRQTNHCIRSTAICYMRRAGMSWETIIKVRPFFKVWPNKCWNYYLGDRAPLYSHSCQELRPQAGGAWPA